MRLLALTLAFCLLLTGQAMRLNLGQLRTFLRSSVQLQHDDKRVADYIKRVALSERITERDIEELAGEGIGPRTVEALRALIPATANMPSATRDTAPRTAEQPRIPGPSDAEQKRLIADARDIALNYTKRLPDFICLQVTRRYVDPSGLEVFQLADTLAARLSYFEQKENYKTVSVNGRLTDVDMDKLGGATSSGEFGSMLKQIFEPETEAEFWWERWAKLRGRVVHVFGYRVRQARSKWHIVWQRELDYVPGYRGLIYIDKDVPVIYRVTLDAETLPPSFPIQEARTQLDYEYTDISGSEFLLPLRAEMRMREGRFLVRNNVEFRNYRKFGAEATITYDIPDELSAESMKEETLPQATPRARPPGKK
ncbi:MAG: hypothetical protein C0504_03030 [Candidatus Solibacter sp.]|nr:hypothetical protein [Candidatus Solibacter sp.]